MIKRTLQEIANFFDMAVAVDEDSKIYMHKVIPYFQDIEWMSGDFMLQLPRCLVNYSGDWRESLTLPDSWPKELPFKDGELVIGKATGAVAKWGVS